MNDKSLVIKQILLDSNLNRLDTKLLLCHVLGFSRTQLITRDDYKLTRAQFESYNLLYAKCLAGMPMAYILGYKEFYSRIFKVNTNTLIPRPETELLVDTVLALAKPMAKVLDLGTGSGCIAISCKLEQQALSVTATDKYPEALAIAISNAADLGADIKFINCDWLDGITDIYDIIVSNPPYIANNDKHLPALSFEPQHALTDFFDGMSAIRKIIEDSKAHLNGYLLIEHGYDQGSFTTELMLKYGFRNIRTIRDYASLDRITIGYSSNVDSHFAN